MNTLARIFIILGLFLCAVAGYNIWLRNDPNRLTFKNYKSTHTVSSNTHELPQRILINGIDIDVPLIPSQVTDNSWQMTDAGASYLTSSPIPGSKGNSIIYAHNWPNLFGKLVHVKPGEMIEIEFPDKSRKVFVVEYTSVVTPDQSVILAPSQDKRVTLYTCTGFLDSKRFVAVALLKE